MPFVFVPVESFILSSNSTKKKHSVNLPVSRAICCDISTHTFRSTLYPQNLSSRYSTTGAASPRGDGRVTQAGNDERRREEMWSFLSFFRLVTTTAPIFKERNAFTFSTSAEDVFFDDIHIQALPYCKKKKKCYFL